MFKVTEKLKNKLLMYVLINALGLLIVFSTWFGISGGIAMITFIFNGEAVYWAVGGLSSLLALYSVVIACSLAVVIIVGSFMKEE